MSTTCATYACGLKDAEVPLYVLNHSCRLVVVIVAVVVFLVVLTEAVEAAAVVALVLVAAVRSYLASVMNCNTAMALRHWPPRQKRSVVYGVGW